MIKLLEHQKKIFNQAKDNVGYFVDMGLGKTFLGSEHIKKLNNKDNLILCQKSKITDWYKHMQQYEYEVFAIRDVKTLNDFINCEKNKVGIINYDKVYRTNYNKLLTLTDFTLAIDESSILGNTKTRIVKTVFKMKFKNIILMSGTPTSGKYEKLYAQLKLLGYPKSEWSYKGKFLNMFNMEVGGRKIKVLNKYSPYKNVEELKLTMHKLGCIFMKTEEVYSLPKQNFYDLIVRKDNNYREFEKERVVETPTKYIGDTILNYRLGLRQLTNDKSKQQKLLDLIDSTEKRIIIFYNFNSELEFLKTIKRPLSYINGDGIDLKNYNDFEDSVTLVQYQAGAKGHNLQKANILVFYSPTEKCEDYMQSIKRIHRIGQEQPCFYYRLITKSSIEVNIYNALERGVDFTDELFRKTI